LKEMFWLPKLQYSSLQGLKVMLQPHPSHCTSWQCSLIYKPDFEKRFWMLLTRMRGNLHMKLSETWSISTWWSQVKLSRPPNSYELGTMLQITLCLSDHIGLHLVLCCVEWMYCPLSSWFLLVPSLAYSLTLMIAQYFPPKHQWTPTSLHSVKSQRTLLVIQLSLSSQHFLLSVCSHILPAFCASSFLICRSNLNSVVFLIVLRSKPSFEF
jgi:hypothetical protein